MKLTALPLIGNRFAPGTSDLGCGSSELDGLLDEKDEQTLLRYLGPIARKGRSWSLNIREHWSLETPLGGAEHLVDGWPDRDGENVVRRRRSTPAFPSRCPILTEQYPSEA